jgi:glucosylceramidase
VHWHKYTEKFLPPAIENRGINAENSSMGKVKTVLFVTLLLASKTSMGADKHLFQCKEPQPDICINCQSKGLPQPSPNLGGVSEKLAAQLDHGRVMVFETTFENDKIHSLVPKQSLDLIPSESQRALAKDAPAEDTPVLFEINPQDQHQKVIGYGAAFTESCTMQLTKLPKKMQNDFLEKMFSKQNGAGFDMMRLPMGATDFSDPKRGNYTYDDSKDNKPDPEFKHFNMDRDEPTFKVIREALKVNPNLKVMISPWSAPAWMKSSKQINGGNLLQEHLQDYANYFVRVIKEYKKRGVPVESLTIQNEPYFDWEGVPSMGWALDDHKKFIADYLGPTMEKNGIDTKIFAYDHNWSGSSEANEVIDDKKANKYVQGAAFHCYNGSEYSMLDTMRPHPNLPIMQTECTAVDYPTPNTAEADFHTWSATQGIGAARMGAAGAIAWNLCLNEKHGPNNWAPGLKGCENCRGLATVDFSKKSPQVRFEPEYYALAQLSRFLDPSFRHVAAEDEWKSSTISIAPFVNTNGEMVVGAQNQDTKPATIEVRLPDCRSFTYKLPARSAATFLFTLGSMNIQGR